MKKVFLFTALWIGIFSIGCNKDEEDTAASKKDLLIAGSWKLTAVVSDDDGDGTYETNDFIHFFWIAIQTTITHLKPMENLK